MEMFLLTPSFVDANVNLLSVIAKLFLYKQENNWKSKSGYSFKGDVRSWFSKSNMEIQPCIMHTILEKNLFPALSTGYKRQHIENVMIIPGETYILRGSPQLCRSVRLHVLVTLPQIEHCTRYMSWYRGKF